MFELTGKYANATVFTDIVDETTISQTIELLNQPMFEKSNIKIMPDCHAGKGAVIGFTAKLNKNNKRIIPGIVGVDIGCGVLSLIFTSDDIDYKKLDEFINTNIPSGMSVNQTMYPKIHKNIKDDIKTVCQHIKTDPAYHMLSMGTLGGGNHYIEIGRIENNKYLLTIHTGSRNLGKMTCDHYQKIAEHTVSDARAELINRHKTAETSEEHIEINRLISELPKVPKDLAYIKNNDYDDYINDMLLCKNIAAENRRIISEQIMLYLELNHRAELIERFDTVHNYVDIEDDDIIIRKGAISARYGKKLAIPLNMRDGVIIATGKGNPEWNCSAPHGAGRVMSRAEAKAKLSLDAFKTTMEGINTWSVELSTLDESPMAYKPAEDIISVIPETVVINKIAKPIYNFKAH